MSELTALFENFAVLFMESAPWLLLGLLIAGLMHELVPVDILKKHMGNASTKAIGKAAVIGAPLPLCSCGVIPAAIGLRRSGASKPATVSFLVATPETGVDSVSVSYALLGPVFAIVRPVAAITSAIYAGLMVKWFDTPDANNQPHTVQAAATEADTSSACCSTKQPETKPKPASASSCCSTQTQVAPVTQPASCCSSAKKTEPAEAKASCCSTTAQQKAETIKADSQSLSVKAQAIWQFSTVKLLNDLTLWLLIGLSLAAAIQTWVPHQFLTQWGDGFMAMLIMAVIGIPMYICATASTPVAVGFLAAGLSPGAVLVFLLAGPATNISTMGMIAKEMGKRTLVLYVFSVVSISILLGYALNIAIQAFELSAWIPLGQGGHDHNDISAIYALCAMLLFGLMIRNSWQSLQQRFAKPASSSCCH
ncbi:SO_0444 family Cu/Zn efflux transporter [Marisediminitalea sp.]|uniref:SO_0444 family Cu/Zn efflux transporter n=1 Tax=Marisediminitalea sp. TaxID=2662268 RepID=UPI003517FCA7